MGGVPDALFPLRLQAAARVSPTALIFHVAAQEGRDGLGQLIFAFPGVSPFFSGEKHQTQHIALAEDGGGGSGMGVQVIGADGQGGVSPALLIDTALFHKLLHLGRNSPVYKLPLAGACGGNDAVPVGDDGGEIRGPGQDVAELGRKILQSADKGILLKNNLYLNFKYEIPFI